MNNEQKLFMVLVGFKPKGFNTEQHDILFVIGNSIEDAGLQQEIKKRLPIPAKTQIHIDAYIVVEQVGGYKISIEPGNNSPATSPGKDLYFANLGGYKQGQFVEYHKPMLLVLEKLSEVREYALKDPFMRQMDSPHAQAKPHLDDNLNIGVDVDDYFRVGEHLEGHRIVLTPYEGRRDSILNVVITGYLKLEV